MIHERSRRPATRRAPARTRQHLQDLSACFAHMGGSKDTFALASADSTTHIYRLVVIPGALEECEEAPATASAQLASLLAR